MCQILKLRAPQTYGHTDNPGDKWTRKDNRTKSEIDYILITPGIEPTTEVRTCNYGDQLELRSDHRPVTGDFELKEPLILQTNKHQATNKGWQHSTPEDLNIYQQEVNKQIQKCKNIDEITEAIVKTATEINHTTATQRRKQRNTELNQGIRTLKRKIPASFPYMH
jgi:hypothetical protein